MGEQGWQSTPHARQAAPGPRCTKTVTMRREYIDTMPNLAATWLSRMPASLQALRAVQAIPSQCAICGRWPGPRICTDCHRRWGAEQQRCRRCALPLQARTGICGACLKQPPSLQRCTAVLDYGYPWQGLITRYKFDGDLGLVHSLARLMSAHPETLQCLQDCDALLPMPSSAQRIRERGFDHMALLAKVLARQSACRVPLLTQVVQRQHVELPQHNASRPQRLRQLRGVFSLQDSAAAQVTGQHLLVLDDVMTTGATLDALAQCLHKAGAASVSALVLARTG